MISMLQRSANAEDCISWVDDVGWLPNCNWRSSIETKEILLSQLSIQAKLSTQQISLRKFGTDCALVHDGGTGTVDFRIKHTRSQLASRNRGPLIPLNGIIHCLESQCITRSHVWARRCAWLVPSRIRWPIGRNALRIARRAVNIVVYQTKMHPC